MEECSELVSASDVSEEETPMSLVSTEVEISLLLSTLEDSSLKEEEDSVYSLVSVDDSEEKSLSEEEDFSALDEELEE